MREKCILWLVLIINFILSSMTIFCEDLSSVGSTSSEKKTVSLEDELDRTIEELKQKLQIEKEKKRQKDLKKQIRHLERQRKIQQKNRFELYQEEIKLIKQKHGVELYVGEAVAYKSYGEDFGETIEKAKQRAISNLAAGIKIKVESVVKDELSFATGKGVDEKFNRVIKTYVDDLLTKPQIKIYEHYPKKNSVTAVAYVSKQHYDEVLEQRLKSQVSRIIEFISKGFQFLKSGMIIQALKSFSQGWLLLEKEFYYLPLRFDVNNDGEEDDLIALTESKIFEIVQCIKILVPDEKIFFTSSGVVGKSFTLKSVYVSVDKNEIPLENLPIRVVAIKGTVEPAVVQIVTNRIGEAEVKIDRISPDYKEVKLFAEVDLKSIGIPAQLVLPSEGCTITLYKKSKVILACKNSYLDTQKQDNFFCYKLIPLLTEYGFEVEDWCDRISEVTKKELNLAKTVGADYLLFVKVYSTADKLGEYEMFYSNVSLTLEIYSIDYGLISQVDNNLNAKGYGVSASDAVYNAKTNILEKLFFVLKEELSKLK